MKTFNKNFNLMIIGQIISLFGATILKFTLSLYVLDVTGKAEVFATILAVSTLPVIVLSPIGGAIVDRFNRRNLMVIFDFCSSGIVMLYIFLLFCGKSSVLVVGVIITLLSVISTMYQPTVQASIPIIVSEDNIIKANGAVAGVGALTNIVGPILGGLLYSFIGLKPIIVVSCICFFLSAVMEIFIQIPFVKQEKRENIIFTILEDMKNGLRYITKQNPDILKFMLLAAGLNLFLIPLFMVGVPYIIKITMSGSDTFYGIAQAAISFSSILGAVAVGLIGKKLKIEKFYQWLIAMGLFLLPMALSVTPTLLDLGFWISFILFTGCTMIVFCIASIFSIYIISIIQKETPNEMLGKVMAITLAVASCATPIGQIIYGGLLDSFSATAYVPILIACVIVIVMAGVAKVILKR